MKFLAFIAVPLLLIAGCSAPIMKAGLLPDGENVKRVFVVHDYWHAALVVRKADLPEGTVPEQDHFPEAEYLELSWGDRITFQLPKRYWFDAQGGILSRGSVLP